MFELLDLSKKRNGVVGTEYVRLRFSVVLINCQLLDLCYCFELHPLNQKRFRIIAEEIVCQAKISNQRMNLKQNNKNKSYIFVLIKELKLFYMLLVFPACMRSTSQNIVHTYRLISGLYLCLFIFFIYLWIVIYI